ncbi:MAG: flagellin [Methanomicrobiales archaeon]|nr:flagellin [Methanomicrobiales archaeon]
MSAETFTTALFLITAIIAAGVLINAVFPVVYQMSGTFSSATHESDERMRTDIKIVATYGNTGGVAQVYFKNIGTTRIALSQIRKGDVFFGPTGTFTRLTNKASLPLGDDQWYANLIDDNSNEFWDAGETLEIDATTSSTPLSVGDTVYFQFVLPNGVWRSTEFSVVSA